MEQLNVIANYYFNLGFNITHISLSENEYHKNLKTTLYHWDVKLKAPSHDWQKYYETRQTLAELNEFNWRNANGLGVVLGCSNLRALDIDDCNDEKIIEDMLKILNLPINYEWVVRSGSKNGFHILFYAENHNYETETGKIKAFKPNENYNFKHIELRWSGHLVLPPSIHPTYNKYEFLNKEIPYHKPETIAIKELEVLINKFCKNDIDSFNEIRKKVGDVLLKSHSFEIALRANNSNELEIYYCGYKLTDEDIANINELIASDELYLQDYFYNNMQYQTYSEKSSIEYYKRQSLREIRENYFRSKLIEEGLISTTDTSGMYIDYNEEYYKPATRFLFFDTETTGLPKDWNASVNDSDNWPRLVQLSYLLYNEHGYLIEEGDYIIIPEGFRIPVEASNIHNITTEKAINEGYLLKYVLEEFRKIVIYKADILVAHNINFDSKIIDAEFLRNGIDITIANKKSICTMESTINFCAIDSPRGYKYPKLAELYYKLFKSEYANAHDASADVIATAKCFFELLKLRVITVYKSNITYNKDITN